VLLDLNLPKADGREILEAMRASDSLSKVPVVILTSSNSLREREQLIALRISRHIVKPPDLAEFIKLGTVVKEVLAEHLANGHAIEAPG
jgi:two-component system response regulator